MELALLSTNASVQSLPGNLSSQINKKMLQQVFDPNAEQFPLPRDIFMEEDSDECRYIVEEYYEVAYIQFE